MDIGIDAANWITLPVAETRLFGCSTTCFLSSRKCQGFPETTLLYSNAAMENRPVTNTLPIETWRCSKFHCNLKQWTRPNYIPLFDMDKSNQQPVSIQLVLLTNLFCWLNFHVSWQIPTLQHAENTTPCFSVGNKHMCCSNVDVLLFKPINILMNYPNSKPKVAQKSQRITFSNKKPRIFLHLPSI